MRVLGVVLYVAVLLCFFNIAAAAVCGDHGREHLDNKCVCDSGYAGDLCDSTLPADCDPKPVEATTATDFPVLDQNNATSFRGNHLRTAIISDYVAGRRYLELDFIGATSKNCSFGTEGSFWTKTANCSDRFSLDLPWIYHRSCGFKNDSRSTTENLVIAGQLWIKYEDIVDEMEEFNITRKVSVPYKMFVTFQRFITVELLSLNITSDVHFGVALTGDEYNPETGILTLELTTIINYPNLFHVRYTRFFKPSHVKVIQGYQPKELATATDVVPSVVADATPGAPVCSVSAGPCKQTWTMTVTIDDSANETEACTFDGDYAIEYRLYTCRGTDSDIRELDCTFTYSWVNWTLSTSDICGKIDIKPTVTGELLAFSAHADNTVAAAPAFANNRGDAKDLFKLGQYAWFYADVESDGNTIQLTFEDVKFAVKSSPTQDVSTIAEEDYKYIWKNRATSALPHVANVKFQARHDIKAFHLYFHSSVFQVPPTETVHFVISANCSIIFEGNNGETKKRTVEYTYEASSMDASTKVGLSNGEPAAIGKVESGKAASTVSPLTFIASVVGAVAGTLIIVFVVVGFALRTRSQSEKRDAPASAAVSAASAAAATIEVAVNRA